MWQKNILYDFENLHLIDKLYISFLNAINKILTAGK